MSILSRPEILKEAQLVRENRWLSRKLQIEKCAPHRNVRDGEHTTAVHTYDARVPYIPLLSSPPVEAKVTRLRL